MKVKRQAIRSMCQKQLPKLARHRQFEFIAMRHIGPIHLLTIRIVHMLQKNIITLLKFELLIVNIISTKMNNTEHASDDGYAIDDGYYGHTIDENDECYTSDESENADLTIQWVPPKRLITLERTQIKHATQLPTCISHIIDGYTECRFCRDSTIMQLTPDVDLHGPIKIYCDLVLSHVKEFELKHFESAYRGHWINGSEFSKKQLKTGMRKFAHEELVILLMRNIDYNALWESDRGSYYERNGHIFSKHCTSF